MTSIDLSAAMTMPQDTDAITAIVAGLTPGELLALTRLGRAAHVEVSERAERKRAADAERRQRDEVERAQRIATRYSTESLTLDAAADGYGRPGGVHPRQARHLLLLDTVERRLRADREAGTLQNLQGGVYSDCLLTAVGALRRLIEAGNESAEMHGERTAREYREREADARAAHLQHLAAAHAR